MISRTSDLPDKAFILVHGSFHGAWAFEKLAPRLAQHGHLVIARDLPGHGLRARFPRSYAAPHLEPLALSVDRWGGIPRTYLSCTGDNAFPVAVHRRFVREADAFTPDNPTDMREMETSHSPFLSQPERLAEVLLGL